MRGMRSEEKEEEEIMLKKRADIGIEAGKGPKHFEQCVLGEKPSKVLPCQPEPYLLPPYGVPLLYRYYGAGYAVGLVQVPSQQHPGQKDHHHHRKTI